MRSRLVAGLVAAALLGAAGCGADRRPDPPAEDPRAGAALRWGVAPTPHPDVTYQPDVVIVGGGGGAIRSVTDDGLTWRLDPAAPRAAELERGKVMFVTGRAVGRVLDVRRDGADLAVTTGPVDLTEVIRDGRFDSAGPVSLASPVAYPAGEPFWTAPEVPADDPAPEQAGPSGFTAVPLAAAPAAPGIPARPPQPPPLLDKITKNLPAGGLRLLPICCEGGVGTRFTYNQNGVRLVGVATLTMRRPSAGFTLGISGGTVTEARLQINGAAGLKVEFEAARADTTHQVSERVAIPLDFSVPIAPIAGVPFSVTVNQWVTVKTAFGATGAYLKGSGEYTFSAGLGFGYRDGRWEATVPTGLTVTKSLVKSINGISIGVNGFVLAYQARFLAGIGAFGFSAGIYFGFTAGVGVTRGSDAGLYVPGTGGTIRVVCRSATLDLKANYGVGYSIPAPVADVINFFLRVFKTRPIERADGIGKSIDVLRRQQTDPDVPICREK